MASEPTRVVNIVTGWVLEVPLPPHLAVYAVFVAEMAERNNDAYKRNAFLGRVHETDRAYACGNWVALKEIPE